MTNKSSTLPKPFVFVLMPLASDFEDIYKFGIKGAADDVGAYAERIDEQLFSEGMLDRIFNQISKADVVVADMTGRNPNVFYEVGYAHALGKLVILLTQRADDIPFDLKHRQHTVYGGRIETLRVELAAKLRWAIAQNRARENTAVERYSLHVLGEPIPEVGLSDELPLLKGYVSAGPFPVTMHVRNETAVASSEISHVYLFAAPKSELVPFNRGSSFRTAASQSSVQLFQPVGRPISVLESFTASSADAGDGLTRQYRLPLEFGSMPPGAVDSGDFWLGVDGDKRLGEARLRIRLHTALRHHDFAWRFRVLFMADEDQARREFANWDNLTESNESAKQAPEVLPAKKQTSRRSRPKKREN